MKVGNFFKAKIELVSGRIDSGLLKKRRSWLIGLSILVFIILISLVLMLLTPNNILIEHRGDVKITPTDQIKSGERLLDGVKVKPGQENLRSFAVVIENHSDARPQSGLDQASLVFEVVAEGGITRLLAFFDPSVKLSEIGPVRSARTYFLDWVSEIRPVFVHYGGETLTITLIPKYDILDINGMYLSGQYFWRANYRPAPHNTYTSIDKLVKAWGQFGWQETEQFTPWEFKDEVKSANSPSSRDIKFNFSNSYIYNTSWSYDSADNSYLRSQAGDKHIDRISGQQYKAKNVVAQITRIGIRDKEGHMGVETIGGGKALIFQDGLVTQGFWRKNSREERTFFYDNNWQPIKFNRGLTWVEVVEEGAVSY